METCPRSNDEWRAEKTGAGGLAVCASIRPHGISGFPALDCWCVIGGLWFDDGLWGEGCASGFCHGWGSPGLLRSMTPKDMRGALDNAPTPVASVRLILDLHTSPVNIGLTHGSRANE